MSTHRRHSGVRSSNRFPKWRDLRSVSTRFEVVASHESQESIARLVPFGTKPDLARLEENMRDDLGIVDERTVVSVLYWVRVESVGYQRAADELYEDRTFREEMENLAHVWLRSADGTEQFPVRAMEYSRETSQQRRGKWTVGVICVDML